MKSTGIKKRIQELVESISAGMYEREEIIAVALLGALCGQNTFLYGPPGTAKSLISRRIACAFEKPRYFEYLMNRFSTPEEVFGPVSIKALKEDNYVRKTDCYLPKADFAFLDEIWKSSPAILNTLLTLINERIFRNGESIERAPLKALIAASNETPDINQGLEALYDRFIVRLLVAPINERQHFDFLIDSKPTDAETSISESLIIKPDEWKEWMEKIHSVSLSAETKTIIHLIRKKLSEQEGDDKVYVSDRRWQRAAILMKAAAFFNDRSATNHSDAMLLQHVLWTKEGNQQKISDIVSDSVRESGFDSGIDLASIDREKESLDGEIHRELFYSADVYKTTKLGGVDYLECKTNIASASHYIYSVSSNGDNVQVYIPLSKIKSNDEFHPCDRNGNDVEELVCKFDSQGSCLISASWRGQNKYGFKPEVLFHKGDKNQNVNQRLVLSLSNAISSIKEILYEILDKVEKQQAGYEFSLKSVFVSDDKIKIAISGISDQLDNIRLRITDCERLEELCR